MEELYKKKCVPCESKTKAFSDEQIREHLKKTDGWQAFAEDNVKGIRKNLRFIDFRSALGFANEIGDIAEFEGHHPSLNLHDWNQLTITLFTFAIKGISENDFIMAAKIDRALKESEE
jgi:4a-hydroxytetrahydrobiopterin dehydratase